MPNGSQLSRAIVYALKMTALVAVGFVVLKSMFAPMAVDEYVRQAPLGLAVSLLLFFLYGMLRELRGIAPAGGEPSRGND